MSRIKHPVRAIREPFGTAGLIVACIALIAALGGTALAAKGALTGKQKKEVEKIAKKFAGKPGAPGAQGPAGANGKDGAAGKDGTNGTNGTSGAGGKSVVLGTATAGECGAAGGVTVEVEGAGSHQKVCNGAEGEEGEPGEEGKPWTELGVLPPGQTETGTFSFLDTPTAVQGFHIGVTSASFPIPLKEPLPESAIHVIAEGENGAGGGTCPTTSSVTNPAAEPGNLCIFIGEKENLQALVASGPGTAGEVGVSGFALTLVPTEASNPILANGTWAVSAPTP